MINASPPILEQFDFLDEVQARTPGESRLLMCQWQSTVAVRIRFDEQRLVDA